MPYQLKPAFWLRQETDRVESLITLQRYWTTVWTAESLREELADQGITYTPDQMARIGQELITRGVLEEVT